MPVRKRRFIYGHDGREHLRAVRGKVAESSNNTTCNDLVKDVRSGTRKTKTRKLTVDMIAAGTLAIIDITALRLSSMNV